MNAARPITNCRRKKTGPKAGFAFLNPELLGRSSRDSSVSSSAGSFASSGCSVASGSGSVAGSSGSFAGSFASFSSRFGRNFSSFGRNFGSSFGGSSFFFLAASGHGNSQQRGQEDGIFHLISLYVRIKKPTPEIGPGLEIQPTRGF
ncbi:MAG: hypothetical protein Q7J36_08080 [Thiobacillus sp.]|nr:hypothetical protein [Thiobacillus sp.]